MYIKEMPHVGGEAIIANALTIIENLPSDGYVYYNTDSTLEPHESIYNAVVVDKNFSATGNAAGKFIDSEDNGNLYVIEHVEEILKEETRLVEFWSC